MSLRGCTKGNRKTHKGEDDAFIAVDKHQTPIPYTHMGPTSRRTRRISWCQVPALAEERAINAPVMANIAGTEDTTHVVHGQPLACHVTTRTMATARSPSSAGSRDGDAPFARTAVLATSRR